MSRHIYWQSCFGLICSGLVISLTFYGGFTARYSLDQFGNRPRQSIGTLNAYSSDGALLTIAAFGVVFAAYWLGHQASKYLSHQAGVDRTKQFGLWVVVVGFGLVFNLSLLPMYPADAADVYDNIIRGRMAALYHLNPLQDTPSRAFGDPFYRFSAWRQVPSAYGPIWEMLAQVSVQVIGSSDRTLNVIGFKLLNTAGYGLCAVLIALTLRRLAPRRALVGVYLWLWNPLVVYMSSGTGHNDVVMTACLAAAVYCVVRRWYVAGTLMAVLGALIKFIPILLLPVIVIVALRRLGWRRWLRYMAVASLLGGALLVAAYAPYWHGWETLRVERRALMYTGSVATVMRYFLVPAFDQVAFNTSSTKTPVTNALLANGTIILFGLFYLIQLIQLWREREAMTFIRVCARLLLCYLLVASLWFYAWYVIWALALAALLEDTPVRRLVMRFSYLVTWQALFYNYLAVATKGGAWLPWLDLTPVSLYMGYAWGYTGHFLLTSWLRQRRQSADDEQVGRRLAEARQSAGLSLGELSDDLAIRYEVLEQYERGERALRFDHGRLLAQRLRLPLDALLGTKA